MKYSLLLAVLLSVSTLAAVETMEVSEAVESTQLQDTVMNEPAMECPQGGCGDVAPMEEQLLSQNKSVRIGVTGQGVAPMNTNSPAQAYALAKRAAIADGYRMIAERVKGVRIDGQDLIKNMMVQRTSVRTSVNAVVKNANVLETTFKDGLCEVEMEVVLSYSLFHR